MECGQAVRRTLTHRPTGQPNGGAVGFPPRCALRLPVTSNIGHQFAVSGRKSAQTFNTQPRNQLNEDRLRRYTYSHISNFRVSSVTWIPLSQAHMVLHFCWRFWESQLSASIISAFPSALRNMIVVQLFISSHDATVSVANVRSGESSQAALGRHEALAC